METITKTYEVYSLNELSAQVQDEIIEKNSDWNVCLDNWWNHVYEDAENIGLKIEQFDIEMPLDRSGKYCKGKFLQSEMQIAKNILSEHGEDCTTSVTAKEYLSVYDAINTRLAAKEIDQDKADEMHEDNNTVFSDSLLLCYHLMFKNEYQHLTSRHAIRESLISNECRYLKDGTPFNE